jgi:aspartate racemase
MIITMKNKKKIGLIGGVGPQATAKIYGDMIRFAQTKYGAKNNDDFPNVVIESVPIPDFISDTKDLKKAKEMLIESVANLEKAGATILAIGSNTVHILLPELEKVSNLKFISMPQVTANRCKQMNFHKVGILGSPVTKEFGLYFQIFSNMNMQAIYPDDNEQIVVDKIIRFVLAGEDNGKERKEYIRILNHLLNKGADGIILACTELPQAVNYEALGSKVVSSDELLAEALVDYYYS